MPVSDTTEAKLCPECGRLLSRGKVGHGVDFHLDRCATCGGIWFDKNEWEILESRNLHDDVHFIFSSAWQRSVRQEEQRATYEKRMASILGEDDLAKVREFKSWMASHDKRGSILGYLIQADD